MPITRCTPERAGSEERIRLRVGYQPYVSYAPLFIAQEEGYFAERGLDVELVRVMDGNAGTPAIVTGELDVLGAPGNPGMLNAILRGARVRFVADKGWVPRVGCSQLALIARPGVDPAVRAGGAALRRVSPSRATPAFEYFADHALSSLGIDASGVEFLHLPTPILADALASARVDAVSTTEPGVTRLVDAGNRVLSGATEVVPGLPYAFVIYGERLLDQDRRAGERFMAAWAEGTRQYAQGKTERNLDIVAAATGDDRELLRRACWPPFDLEGRLDSAAFAAFQNWAVQRRMLDRRLATSEFWDPHFVEHANRALAAHTH